MGLNSKYFLKTIPTWKRKIFSNKSLNVSENGWFIVTTLHWVLFIVWGKFNMRCSLSEVNSICIVRCLRWIQYALLGVWGKLNMQSMTFSLAHSRVRMRRISDVSGTTSVPIFSVLWGVGSTKPPANTTPLPEKISLNYRKLQDLLQYALFVVWGKFNMHCSLSDVNSICMPFHKPAVLPPSGRSRAILRL